MLGWAVTALWAVVGGAALWAVVYAWRVGIARARVSRLIMPLFLWLLVLSVERAAVMFVWLTSSVFDS